MDPGWAFSHNWVLISQSLVWLYSQALLGWFSMYPFQVCIVLPIDLPVEVPSPSLYSSPQRLFHSAFPSLCAVISRRELGHCFLIFRTHPSPCWCVPLTVLTTWTSRVGGSLKGNVPSSLVEPPLYSWAVYFLWSSFLRCSLKRPYKLRQC